MYLVICENCWARGETEEKARRTCQLIYGKQKMVNFLVYETDDNTVYVSKVGHILRERASERLAIVKRVKDGKEMMDEEAVQSSDESDSLASKTQITVTEEEKKGKKLKKKKK